MACHNPKYVVKMFCQGDEYSFLSFENTLNGWRAFQDSIKNARKDDCAAAHAKTYLYGGEKMVDATPEEVAYMYKRIEMRPDFSEKRTQKIKDPLNNSALSC